MIQESQEQKLLRFCMDKEEAEAAKLLKEFTVKELVDLYPALKLALSLVKDEIYDRT